MQVVKNGHWFSVEISATEPFKWNIRNKYNIISFFESPDSVPNTNVAFDAEWYDDAWRTIMKDALKGQNKWLIQMWLNFFLSGKNKYDDPTQYNIYRKLLGI